MTNLEGKTILVTGGTSKLGEQLLRQSIELNAKNVVGTYHKNEGRANKLKDEIDTLFVPLDLRELESIDFVYNNIEGFLGGIDHLIINASKKFTGIFKEHDRYAIHNIIRTNLMGNIDFIQGMIRKGLMNSGGQISVIGSIAADGDFDQYAYSASLGGLRETVNHLSQFDLFVHKSNLGVKMLELPYHDGIEELQNRDGIINDKRDGEYFPMSIERAATEILVYTSDPTKKGCFKIGDIVPKVIRE